MLHQAWHAGLQPKHLHRQQVDRQRASHLANTAAILSKSALEFAGQETLSTALLEPRAKDRRPLPPIPARLDA